MGKTKNKTKEQTPQERKRTYTMPMARLDLIAERIVAMRPTKQIVLNDLMMIWNDGRTSGYFKNQAEAKLFRDKRDATIKEIFDAIQNKAEDRIHGGVVEQSTNPKDK